MTHWASDNGNEGGGAAVACYDTEWSATGPLIEQYGISLAQNDQPSVEWVAFKNNIVLAWGSDCFGLDGYADDFEYGATPLLAACNLILALHAEGKLKP